VASELDSTPIALPRHDPRKASLNEITVCSVCMAAGKLLPAERLAASPASLLENRRYSHARGERSRP